MIYPELLPDNVKSEAEKKVFSAFKEIENEYDIFYGKRFSGILNTEKVEYEIDFLVADKPSRNSKCKAILCMEVKGGLIEYDGGNNTWSQNGKKMKKSPELQASGSLHSLINRYNYILNDVAMDWILCFPDCEVPTKASPPTNFSFDKVIDKHSTLYLDQSISSAIDTTKQKFNKRGLGQRNYNKFKESLLRSVGFVTKLNHHWSSE